MLLHSGTAFRRFGLTIREMYFTGVLSLIIILVSGLFVGMVLGLQGYETLQRYGSESALGTLVALSLVRELGPVLAGLLFASRAGSAITAEIGAGRTAIRISPVTPANDAFDPNPQPLFTHVVEGLARYGLSYVHIIEGATGGPRDHQQGDTPFDYAALRATYHAAGGKAAWMVNNGYNRELAIDAVEEGKADLVAFGKLFIANPDLVKRLKEDLPLNTPDKDTFYGGGAKGYTDYPALENVA